MFAALDPGSLVDNVFSPAPSTSRPRFHVPAPPTPQEVQHVAAPVAVRVDRMLRRKGLLREPSHQFNETPPVDDAHWMRAATQAMGADGASASTRVDVRSSRCSPISKRPLAAEVDGYCVEATVHVGALDRKGREELARSRLRSAIANERLSILKDGSIAWLCKDPTRGKTHRVMQPMDRMARLAQIIAPPRSPLWRYDGVLASGAPGRKHIVPRSVHDDAGCTHKLATNTSHREPKGKQSRKPTGDPSLLRASPEPVAPTSDKPPWRPSTSYVPWAALLRHCFMAAACGGPRVPHRTRKLVPFGSMRMSSTVPGAMLVWNRARSCNSAVLGLAIRSR